MEMTCFVNGIKIAMPYHELKYEALTKRIIGCAMKVHRYLGHGFPEIIYHRALKIELEKEKLKNLREVAREIYNEGIWVGLRRLDLLIEDVVLVELKATTEIKSADYNQVINLLKVFGLEVTIHPIQLIP
jgi:GxxExxY protein